MIPKHELRIGNLVNYEQTTHVIEEFGKGLVVHYWHRRTNEEVYVSGYEEISPIELTPELLEKAGFENIFTEDIYDGYKLGDFVIERYHFTNEKRWFVISFSAWQCEIEVKYLHQLQNLYFALTNSELEINL